MTTDELAKVFAGESLQEPFVPAPRESFDPRDTDQLDCDHMPDGLPFTASDMIRDLNNSKF